MVAWSVGLVPLVRPRFVPGVGVGGWPELLGGGVLLIWGGGGGFQVGGDLCFHGGKHFSGWARARTLCSPCTFVVAP